MRFLMLVKASKDSEAGVLPGETILSEMGRYNEQLVTAGALLAAEGLKASSEGVRVRYSNGKFTVVDGPFAEAKELIAGFWLVQASSKGARVRYSGSKRTVIDGPFAETKELIAGYAILQLASRDEAIEWTRRFVQVDAPGRLGAESECELRPIFEIESNRRPEGLRLP